MQERQLPAQVNVTIVLKKLVSTLLALQRQSTVSVNTTYLSNTNFCRDHTENFFQTLQHSNSKVNAGNNFVLVGFSDPYTRTVKVVIKMLRNKQTHTHTHKS